ncbi:hypothetical protein QBC38DRAFT_504573 [Podospora fimiseda]|uniref:Uncharacterized protein n=1 Tax=Podospora fimiseda TaxID=252190 RepID=A0AAN7BDJ7_9PEZI|nr:hypothetical protein QBC38DRAFT_504573 [Podospora fimiseda]
MSKSNNPPPENNTYPGIIAQEFFGVLGRHEALQNIFCDNTCLCPQFTQGMHLILPCWDWGVNKIICFGLGSFKNVVQNGLSKVPPLLPNAEVPLTTLNSLIFNKSPLDRNDPVQVMIRHIAALDIVAALRIGSNPKGIEHAVAKGFSRILTKVVEQKGWASLKEGSKEWKIFVGKIKEVYDNYTERDKEVFKVLDWMLKIVWEHPVRVVGIKEAYGLVDSRTLVYTVDLDFPVRTSVLTKGTPVAMVWRGHDEEDTEDAIADDVRERLKKYQEFQLNKAKAPHTIGLSHWYIRKDAIVSAWQSKKGCFPPWKLKHPFDNASMDKVADQLLAEGLLNKPGVVKPAPAQGKASGSGKK